MRDVYWRMLWLTSYPSMCASKVGSIFFRSKNLNGCKSIRLIHLHCIRQLVEFNDDRRRTHAHKHIQHICVLYTWPIIQWQMTSQTNDTQKLSHWVSHMFSISTQIWYYPKWCKIAFVWFDFQKFVHYKSSTHTKISIKSSNMHITFCLLLSQIPLKTKKLLFICLFQIVYISAYSFKTKWFSKNAECALLLL